MFAIDAEKQRAFEWSSDLGTWSLLDNAGSIVDPVFATPLPIAALVSTAVTSTMLARALVARRHPVIEEVREEGREEGRITTVANLVLAVLAARAMVVDDRQRARILGERDPALLEHWHAVAVTCASVAELFLTP